MKSQALGHSPFLLSLSLDSTFQHILDMDTIERFQQVAHSLVGKMVTEMDFVTGIWEAGLSPVTHMNLL